jgi:uncharacterized membrane protein
MLPFRGYFRLPTTFTQWVLAKLTSKTRSVIMFAPPPSIQFLRFVEAYFFAGGLVMVLITMLFVVGWTLEALPHA